MGRTPSEKAAESVSAPGLGPGPASPAPDISPELPFTSEADSATTQRSGPGPDHAVSDRGVHWFDEEFSRISQTAGLRDSERLRPGFGDPEWRPASAVPPLWINRPRPRRYAALVLIVAAVIGMTWMLRAWETTPKGYSDMNIAEQVSHASPPTSGNAKAPAASEPVSPVVDPPAGLNSIAPASGDATAASPLPQFALAPPRPTPPEQFTRTDEQSRPAPPRQWDVGAVQRELARFGYYKGSVDGKVGPVTRRAIRAFQVDAGLKPTGRIAPSVTTALERKVRETSRSAGKAGGPTR